MQTFYIQRALTFIVLNVCSEEVSENVSDMQSNSDMGWSVYHASD